MLSLCKSTDTKILLYPFQTVASVEDDRWQENIEEHFRVKGHLSQTQTESCLMDTRIIG